MRLHIPLLVAVVAAVLLAGCTAIPGSSPAEETPDVVTVTGPTCFVEEKRCSNTRLTKFSNAVTVTVTVNNNGQSPITVTHGVQGSKIMISTCNIVEPTGFSRKAVGAEQLRDEPGEFDSDRKTRLTEDEQLVMTWTLEIPEDVTVSRLGYRCPMAFEAQFDQHIRSSRQIQLKQWENVTTVSSIDSGTTSTRPVRLVIDAPKSFVADADAGRTLVARSFLRNVGSGTITDITGITAQGWLADNTEDCSPDEIRMYQRGQRAGTSYRKRCTIVPDKPVAPSEIQWLEFAADYTYNIPLRSITLTLDPVEDGE